MPAWGLGEGLCAPIKAASPILFSAPLKISPLMQRKKTDYFGAVGANTLGLHQLHQIWQQILALMHVEMSAVGLLFPIPALT